MIPTTFKDYYGDETRWFVGYIVDINDPEQLGRVRVRIFGVHPDDPGDADNSDLPWASVVAPITEGSSSGIGANTGLKNRAQVFGIFLDGKNSQLPLVLGGIPKYEQPPLNPLDPNELTQEKENRRGAKTKPIVSTRIDEEKLRGASNVEKAFNFFMSPDGGGFSAEQTCGILGNFAVENGIMLRNVRDFDPTIQALEKDGTRAFGLAQWNEAKRAGNRLGELIKFSTERGYSYRSMYAQLAFTKYELYKYSYFGLADLLEQDTIEGACEVFEKKYERPAAGSTEARKEEARKIYEQVVS